MKVPASPIEQSVKDGIKIMQCKTLLKSILTVSLVNTSLTGLSVPVIAKPLPVIQTTAQAINQLNEKEIKQILEAINKAQEEKNVEGVTKFLAPFASGEIVRKTSNTSISTELVGKDVLTNFVKFTLDNIKQRRVIEQQVSVEILEEGQLGVANVRTVREITTTSGEKYYSASRDTLHFAMIDKQPMIVFVKIEGWLIERSAKK